MQKITLEINNSIYDYIMFFLENIPKNLLNIKEEIKVKKQNYLIDKRYKKSSISKIKNLQGIGKELYQGIDSDKYIKELRESF